MRFDGGFTNAKLMRNLFVEQTAAEHMKHAPLLRRQVLEPGRQLFDGLVFSKVMMLIWKRSLAAENLGDG